MRTRSALTVETTTLLYLFFGAACAWLVLKSAPKLYKGRLEAIDNDLLRVLRRPQNPAVAVLLAVIVGISRAYLGVHYPSDVLAGWAAGSLWSSVCAQAARWLQHQGGVEPPMETGESRSVISRSVISRGARS